MEFNEKLQNLRRGKGLTQEELAAALFVSRTAVSKWESGRGYPGIDSLKQIAKFFGVTVDELLSCSEVLSIAEEESKQRTVCFRTLVFGLLDISVLLLFFLPFFAYRTGAEISEVSLAALESISPYLKILYMVSSLSIALWGILTLALQNCRNALWEKTRALVSLILSASFTLLLMVSLQPYAAALCFVFLMIKVLILVKKQ